MAHLLMLRLFFFEPNRPWMKTIGAFLTGESLGGSCRSCASFIWSCSGVRWKLREYRGLCARMMVRLASIAHAGGVW